jgi:hypothetical protein
MKSGLGLAPRTELLLVLWLTSTSACYLGWAWFWASEDLVAHIGHVALSISLASTCLRFARLESVRPVRAVLLVIAAIYCATTVTELIVPGGRLEAFTICLVLAGFAAIFVIARINKASKETLGFYHMVAGISLAPLLALGSILAHH